MPKKPENEDQAWILAYSIAAGLLTLGYSASGHGRSEGEVDLIDERAEQIADNALRQLKRRKVV